MSSEDTKSSESPKSRRPATRSTSLRQSLNFASVGKAIIAGVGRHSKESSQEDKATKKATKTSRRSSAILPTPPPAPSISASRTSIGGESRTASAAAAIKREVTPDNKVVTRRRAAAQAKAKTDDTENMQQKSPNSATPISAIRVSSRTRAANAPSGLPKPRSVKPAATENTPAEKPSTPVRTGTRRRLSESSDEGEKEQQKRVEDRNNARPISPLPHRAALKNSNVVNATPPATPSTPTSRAKPPSPFANRSSPTRPTKLLKTTNNTSASRPSSSASVGTPRTPKASALKAALTRSAKDKSATPLKGSVTPTRNSPSPLARRFGLRPASSNASSNTGNMSHISEGTSEDSDEDDVVELLLAPVTSPNLTAPTPAVPRIMPKDRRNNTILLETPSKDKLSISKADKSRLQPPLQTQGPLRPQTASLRVPKQSQMNGTANSRKSILTWEQLSSDASRTLGEGEAERMITEMPAPFSGPTSPALSALIDIPPSPCLSSIDSPGGFGSISQVLLPDVTPSPAVFAHARFNVSAEASAESSSTYLRLQLASAEHLAHERLLRIQAMEEEIHNLKSAHSHQIEEVASQVAYMEREDQKAKFSRALEEQIWQVRVKGEESVAAARAEVEAHARAERESALKTQRAFCQVSCSAKSAVGSWASVVDTCQAEMQSIQGERQMLALLVAELEALGSIN